MCWLNGQDVYRPRCDLDLSRVNRVVIRVLSSYNSPKKLKFLNINTKNRILTQRILNEFDPL